MNDKKIITITIEEYNLLLEKQKQVDEVKASREIEINELHEQHAIVSEEIKKDTAKEIYLWLKSRYPKLSFEQSFIEKFGIEVGE